MALLSVIRRWHNKEGMHLREIVRRTGLSRNTVRKSLVSNVVEPRYLARKSPSKLDDYEEVLNSWLHRESKRYRRQRKSLKSLHVDLVALGYSGSTGWPPGGKSSRKPSVPPASTPLYP